MAYQDAFRNGARRTPLLDDDLRGFISDGATGSLSTGQVVETILDRIGARASLDCVLAAAVAVLGEQAERIAELETEADELGDDVGLEVDIAELKVEIKALRSRRAKGPTS